MVDENRVWNVVENAVDEFNETHAGEYGELQKSPEASLFGEGASLESLGLVHFIVGLEERIEDEFKRSITLADDRALAQEQSPFRTLATLTHYISQLLAEREE